MAVSKLYKQREEVKQLVEVAEKSEEKKKRWRKVVPHMLPSELLELRMILLRQLVLDAEFETIGEAKKGKKVPEDEESLLEYILAKVLHKVDQVEERTKMALAR